MKNILRGALVALLLLTFITSYRVIGSKTDTYYRNQVAVLMYHHLSDDKKSSSTITTTLFREQLNELTQRNYHFIDLKTLKSFLSGGPVPDNAVFVSFDDGYESYHQLALPIMQEFNVPSINFLITSFMDGTKTINIPVMNLVTVRKILAETPLAEFGTHTHDLHFKKDGVALLLNNHTETDAEYNSRIRKDLDTSIAILKSVAAGGSDALAYPFGIYDQAAIKLAAESGIRYAFTINPGMTTHRTNPMAIPRINVGSPTITADMVDFMIRQRIVAV
ncbi:MAG: polysaccharide deacetylase family protein, partial [Gorillibacterium sp.]|nr:polysaccharide deacetylase family protein [Gorillibacterium sp.]